MLCGQAKEEKLKVEVRGSHLRYLKFIMPTMRAEAAEQSVTGTSSLDARPTKNRQ